MSLSIFLPIFVLLLVFFICIATAIVLLFVKPRKSLLRDTKDEPDWVDKLIDKKKQELASGLGGVTWTEYITVLIIFPLVLGIVSYIFFETKALCIVFVVIGLFVPEIMLMVLRKRRKEAYDEQYARALKTFASALRSGLTIAQAVDEVGNSRFVDENIRVGFRQISADITVGIPLDKAFHRYAESTESIDAKDVAIAISMQSKVGGSESVVISAISQNIYERIMTRREIKTMFAETDVLVIVMDALPWLVIGAMYFLAPQFVKPYFESWTMTVVLVGIMMFTTLGSFIIHKIAKSAKGG